MKKAPRRAVLQYIQIVSLLCCSRPGSRYAGGRSLPESRYFGTNILHSVETVCRPKLNDRGDLRFEKSAEVAQFGQGRTGRLAVSGVKRFQFRRCFRWPGD
jgi:hypothetical protein